MIQLLRRLSSDRVGKWEADIERAATPDEVRRGSHEPRLCTIGSGWIGSALGALVTWKVGELLTEPDGGLSAKAVEMAAFVLNNGYMGALSATAFCIAAEANEYVTQANQKLTQMGHDI